jgi:energy-coupling factor transporter transmembrane protein EcfT
MFAAGLYLAFLFIHPDFAYALAGVLLSVALAGLAVVVRLPATEVLSPLASVHPAWYAAMLVQAAFWWSEGEEWERWMAPTR